MNRKKANLCTALLFLVIVGIIITLLAIGEKGVILFRLATAFVTGIWLADRLEDFRNWLREDKNNQ